jgi:hypothetical protein
MPRVMTSGIVKTFSIGKPAGLLSKSARLVSLETSDMIGYERVSETERVLVSYESLINSSLLKVQSNPYRKTGDEIAEFQEEPSVKVNAENRRLPKKNLWANSVFA